jgi:hypothetical protein
MTIMLSVLCVITLLGSHVLLDLKYPPQKIPSIVSPIKVSPGSITPVSTVVETPIPTPVPTIIPTPIPTPVPTTVPTPVPTTVLIPIPTEVNLNSSNSQQPIIPYHTVEAVPTISPTSGTDAEKSVEIKNVTPNETIENITVGDWKYPSETVVNETSVDIKSTATEFYRWVPYTYDGNRTVIMLTLNTTVYEKFALKNSHCEGTLESCYHKYVDDNYQKEYMESLVRDLKGTSDNTDIQALHAIRFVQSLPYNNTKYIIDPTEWNYPYETLYNDGGVCSDKSELLVYLLRELGFATVIFHFGLEDHAAVGIKTNHTIGYAGTEYSFIETTTPAMIGYSNMTYNNGTMRLHTDPDIITMSTGDSMGRYVNDEINDAREMNRIDGLGKEVDKNNYTIWKRITTKYGM